MQTLSKKPVLVVFLFICLNSFFLTSTAQTKKEDSLLQVLNVQKDTAKISTYLKLAALHFKDTTNAATQDLNKAYDLAKKSGEKKYLGDYFLALAKYTETKGDFDAVVEQYKEALTMYIACNYIPGQMEVNFSNGIWHARNAKFRPANNYFLRAAELAKTMGNTKALAQNLYFYAKTFQSLGEHPASLKYFKLSLDYYIQRNDSDGIAKIYNSMGGCYKDIHDLTNSIDCYVKAEKIFQLMGRKKDYAGCLVNIGNVYNNIPDEKKALSNYYEAEKILVSINDVEYLANVRHNIGNILMDNKKYDEALEKFNQAKDVYAKLGEKDRLAVSLGSVAEIYFRKKQYDKGLPLVIEALEIKKASGDQDGICRYLIQSANFYYDTNRDKEALINYTEALELATKTGLKVHELKALKCLGDLSEKMNDFKLASNYYRRYADLKDTIFKNESVQKIAEMEALYKNEKQSAEIAQLSQQKEVHENQIKIDNLQRNILLCGFVLLLCIAFLIFNRYRLKQRSNLELQSAYDEIQVNRDAISLQRQEMMDSIRYAKRIQDAILPPQEQLNNYFSEHFILYLPKDIVAGDFYWIENVSLKSSEVSGQSERQLPTDDLILFAAADCTGHGVPGAMVSVICHNALNRAIKEFEITDPAKILDKTRTLIIEQFEQSGEEVKDGMDISLCTLNKKTNKMIWAGANNPLWIIRNRELIEYKPDKQPIGKYAENKSFTNHAIELQKGDTLYIFTDGYADQFGGEEGKKLKAAQMKTLFLNIREQSMEEQKKSVFKLFEDWRGKIDQVDDICVMGMRV